MSAWHDELLAIVKLALAKEGQLVMGLTEVSAEVGRDVVITALAPSGMEIRVTMTNARLTALEREVAGK